jgi:hypothetical protein
MLIEIVKSLAGTGDFVSGSRREFCLDTGMVVEVEDSQAAKWVASGIARPVGLPANEACVADPAPATGTVRAAGAAKRIPGAKPGRKGTR